jgi:propionyl-CoA carboxylase alpha chain
MGDRVFRGQTLVVLESMKMESGVASPIDGNIAEILVEDQQVMIRSSGRTMSTPSSL